MKIRELFRQTLENAEVTPSPSTGVNLMKKVARKEFLRFDPFRFNAYYLGAILVAGITAGVLFSSGGTGSATLMTPETPVMTTDTIGPDDNLVAEQPEIVTEEKSEISPEPVASTTQSMPSVTAEVKPAIKESAPDSARAVPVTQTEVLNAIVTKKEPEYLKYQEGFRTVVSKIDYSRRNPAREKVTIKPVIIKDSSAAEELIENALPGKDKLKGGLEKIEPVAAASATEGCPPFKVQFRNESGSGDPAKWTFGDSGYSMDRNPVWVFSDEGEYNVTLSEGSDEVKSSLSIYVYPKPDALFETVPGNEVLPGEEISFKNRSVNSISYSWDFGDGSSSDQFEPRHKYKRTGNYSIKLIVTSDYGCTDTLNLVKTVTKMR